MFNQMDHLLFTFVQTVLDRAIIYLVIEKNIKRLLSSKISASMILFGPLVMIMLIGLAFQSSGFFGIKVGVHADSYGQISDKIIETMEQNKFEVIRPIIMINFK